MEAAASGVPVVATNIRGCREAVEPGINGVLTPLFDVAALADAIGRLLNDDALRESMSRNARGIAERRFDQRRVFARVLETYAKLSPDNSRATVGA
jgi:glycosyltransferase involved in cell wall biosynthesis